MHSCLRVIALRALLIVPWLPPCLAPATLHAQAPEWEWRNPQPTGTPLFACAAFDDGTVLAAGAHSTVLRSRDRGNSWTVQTSVADTLDYISSLVVASNEVAIAAGQHTLLRSTDRGAHWDVQFMEFAPTSLASDRDSMVAATVTGGVLYVSVDAGRTWTTHVLPGPPTARRLVSCPGGGAIVVAVSTGEVLRSTDHGATWTTSTPSPAFSLPRSMHAAGDTLLLLANDVVYRSLDGGGNWESFPAGSGLYCLAMAADGTLLAAGAAGIVRRSTDLGERWHNADSSAGVPLLGICTVGDGTVYAVGQAGLMLRSGDNGQNWTTISDGPRTDINAMDIPRPESGFAVDADGRIYRFRDGGREWTEVHRSPHTLFAVSFRDTSVGLAAGDQGAVLRSSDGGGKWTSAPPLTPNTLWDIAWATEDDVTVTSCCGSFFHSSDAGRKWDTLAISPKQRYYGISFATPDIGVAAGTQGALVRSTDRGRSWSALHSGVSDDLHTVSCVSPSLTLAAGAGGVILRSSDGGTSWVTVARLGRDIWGLQFADTLRGICAGAGGLLAWTSDGGRSWSRSSAVTDLTFFCAAADEDGGVYAGGRAGALLHGRFPPLQHHEDIPSPSRGAALLSLYPLPAGDRMTVSFRLDRPGEALLQVYDVAGRLLRSVRSTARSAGRNAATVPLQDLPGGCYLLLLTTGGDHDARLFPVIR